MASVALMLAGCGRLHFDRAAIRADAAVGRDAESPVDARPRTDAAVDGCTEQAIALTTEPLDFVVIIDDGSSAGVTPDAFWAAMRDTLVPALQARAVPFRVIVFAGRSIDPLPAQTTFFPIATGSGSGGIAPVLDAYGSWVGELRPETRRVVIHFTDGAAGDGQRAGGRYDMPIDDALRSLVPASFARFAYHCVTGMFERAEPYRPDEPVVSTACLRPGEIATGAGGGYQTTAIRNDGLRTSICTPEYYGAFLRAVVDREVARTGCIAEVGASFGEPTLRAGSRELRAFDAIAECSADGYVVEDGLLALCPATCAQLRAEGITAMTRGC